MMTRQQAEQATRNEVFVNLLQDFGFMEIRGYGFNGIVATLRKAGLSPPLVRDNGASFDLSLKSHVLMSPETLLWLRQIDGFDLSPQERLALAYLRVNERLYNRDYVRLTGRTSVEATQDMRHMVDKGALVMQSTRGGAYYVLPKSLPFSSPNLFDAVLTDEERILILAQQKGKITVGMCIKALGLPRWRVSFLLAKLVDRSNLQVHGKLRWRYYTLLRL